MKIGLVCYPGVGGSGIVATELGKGLAESGHEVHFITYRQPARLEDLYSNVFYHSVEVTKYPLFEFQPYEQALSGTIVNVVRSEDLDLVHVHYAVPHLTAALTARETLKHFGFKVPFIVTMHGTDVTVVGKEPYISPVITHGLETIDAVTVVSESLRNDTYHHFKISRKDIYCIYNFVDLKRFKKKKSKLFREHVAPNGEPIISHASNFRPVKRVLDVVRTFYQVRQATRAKLVFVGDGPMRSEAEDLVRKLSLSEDVHFLGVIKKPERVFSESDVFLLPSESESFGLAALEAKACSTAVVSSNAGGLPELVEDGVTGYLCDVGNTEQMANRIVQLLGSPEKLEKMKKASAKRARKFDMKVIIPQYEALYQKLLH